MFYFWNGMSMCKCQNLWTCLELCTTEKSICDICCDLNWSGDMLAYSLPVLVEVWGLRTCPSRLITNLWQTLWWISYVQSTMRTKDMLLNRYEMHEHHKHYYTWMRISLRPTNRSRIRTNVKSVFYTFTIPFLKIILYKSPKGRKIQK